MCLMNVLQPVRLTAPGLRCDEPVLPGRLPASVRAPSARGGAISRSIILQTSTPRLGDPTSLHHEESRTFDPRGLWPAANSAQGNRRTNRAQPTATLRGQPELAVTLCVQPRKADCKTTPQYQQIEETGAA